MLELTSTTSKQWSRIGSRGIYGQAILDLATNCPELVVLSADLGNSSGLDRFKKTYPNQFINVGIAEQNLIGVAAGIAKEGFTVFASSFAPFIAMRASEQVRMNMGYMNLNVKAVGIGSGLVMGFLGNSHFGIEDMAVMRAIPNMTVVCPADCGEIVKTVHAAADFDGPIYIRLTGGPNCPIVYKEDYEFEIGKAIELEAGSEVAIIANGSMVSPSITAAQNLRELGHSVGVFNFHTVKPIDEEMLVSINETYDLIVTVEEHSVIGGLGSAVAEFISSLDMPNRVLRLGHPDQFGKTGEYEFLLQRYGLTSDGITKSIILKVSNS
jgi:transketolase